MNSGARVVLMVAALAGSNLASGDECDCRAMVEAARAWWAEQRGG